MASLNELQAVGVPPHGTKAQPSSQAMAVARSAQAVGVPLQLAPVVQPWACAQVGLLRCVLQATGVPLSRPRARPA